MSAIGALYAEPFAMDGVPALPDPVAALCVERRDVRVKVAIACYPTYGGSGSHRRRSSASALAERGHEVHVLSYEPPHAVRAGDYGSLANVFFHEVQVTAYPLFRYPPV